MNIGKLEKTFNDLCRARFGYLMIPAVVIGVGGFGLLISELARWIFTQ
jgi:hypothetical protein